MTQRNKLSCSLHLRSWDDKQQIWRDTVKSISCELVRCISYSHISEALTCAWCFFFTSTFEFCVCWRLLLCCRMLIALSLEWRCLWSEASLFLQMESGLCPPQQLWEQTCHEWRQFKSTQNHSDVLDQTASVGRAPESCLALWCGIGCTSQSSGCLHQIRSLLWQDVGC